MATNINGSFSAGLDSDRGVALQGNLLNQGNLPSSSNYPEQFASTQQPYAQAYPQQPYSQQTYGSQVYPQQPYMQQPYMQQPYMQQPYAQQPNMLFPQQVGIVQQPIQPYAQQMIIQAQPISSEDKRVKIVEIDQAIASQFSLYSIIMWVWLILLVLSFLVSEILVFTIGSLFQATGTTCVDSENSASAANCNTAVSDSEGVIAGIAILFGVIYLILIHFQWQGIVALRDKISSKARCFKTYLIVITILSFTSFIGSLSVSPTETIVGTIITLGIDVFLLHQTSRLIVLLQERDLLAAKL